MPRRKRLVRLTPLDIKTCWKRPEFSAFTYVSHLNNNEVNKSLEELKEPLCVKFKSAENNNQNRQRLILNLQKKIRNSKLMM